MAVHVLRVPAERSPAVSHLGEIEHVARVPERLLTVHVDHGHEVRQAMVAANMAASQTIPRCTRRHSAIRRHVGRTLEARSEGCADTHGQTMSQRARREVDSWHAVLWMHAEECPVTGVGLEVLREIQPRR